MNNQIINVVCAICCIVYSILIIYVLGCLILKKYKDKIEFIRSFKKGKCTIIYLVAIPLFCIGHMYANESFLNAFFVALNKVVSLVVLRYDFSSISLLMKENKFYEITIYICATLVLLNAILFSISVFYQYLLEKYYKLKLNFSKKNHLYIYGNNQNNIDIYNSAKQYTKFVIDNLSNKDCYNLYCNKVNYLKNIAIEKQIRKFIRQSLNKNIEITTIINTLDEEKNINICKAIIKQIKQLEDNKKDILFEKFHVYVFGEMNYEAIYEDIIENAYGCIHYMNKYQIISMNFIEKYPFTRFMDERHIDYETTLIKDDVDINVCMIGFGKTNRKIFLTSVANNQFLTMNDNKLKLKQVNYHIFDRESTNNDKNLNHNYNRYKKEILEEIQDGQIDKNDYLELPETPANEQFYKMDINDNEFYKNIKNIISINPKSINFIIIAFGTDFENIDMAQKLIEKRKEWNLENVVLFVKSRKYKKEETLLKDMNCYFFANEKNDIYNLEKIKGDIIHTMAKQRNAIYQLEHEITSNPNKNIDDKIIEQNNKLSNQRWYKQFSQSERESNIYACLSIRSKLNLMGLDYVLENDNEKVKLSEEEYLNYYACDDLPDFTYYNKSIDNKKIIHYTIQFKKSRRTTLAIHEHYRWNAYQISKGIIPASKQMILEEKNSDGNFTNGKNYQLRHHGNITTFEGLIEFRKMIAKRDNKTEESKDVIKYDYQLLDDVYWLLNKNGYKIVKK